MSVTDKFKNKRILIWGYGREGKSTEQFFKKFCDASLVEVFEGKREEIIEDNFDFIVKSPGIVMEEDNPKYTSQTDIFLEEYRDCVVGITGTKGKSTTSAMLYHVLNLCLDRKVILLGNIGKPCLDYFDEIDADTVVVFEMSCHQLAHATASPHIAVFLNLFEEHLDYYKTFDKYFLAKAHITKLQEERDFFYVGSNVPEIETKASKTVIDRSDVEDYGLIINGLHNNYNAEFVYRIATERFGVDGAKVKEALKSFEGLAHRLQYIGAYEGVDYYDDSISTIPNATIEALSSIKNAATVLIGGMDRGISYDALVDFINENSQYNYIFSYDSGKRIFDSIVKGENCHYEENLKEAVKLAKEITPKGKACILSPASASYGYFKNFEHRGEVFKELVEGRTTLLFTGDIGFDKYMDQKWDDENLLSGEVTDFILDSDHVIVNVEGPLSALNRDTTVDAAAALLHSMNPEVKNFLGRIKADVWNICNNHIMDAGPKGILDTLDIARECGALTLGAGMNIKEAARPVIIPEAGGIGLIGVGYQRACRKADDETPGCFSWSDLERIKKQIEEIKKNCRWCVVVAHAGEEFTALPSPYTRNRYIEYLNMGADIVVAHHPHVPMNYETFDGKAIFYSLGNFIFDTDYQRSQFNTEFGILMKLHFTDKDFSFEAFGIEIDRNDERVIAANLPAIFEDVKEEEYNKLAPLAAKMFIENTKRQLKYMKPQQFENASEEDFVDNFYEPLRSGRVPGETLDFQIIYPLSKEADKGEWKKSKLSGVVDFMLRQM